MKLLFVMVMLLLTGCAITPSPKSYPMRTPLPICKEGQTDNCRKIDASDMGGSVRGLG